MQRFFDIWNLFFWQHITWPIFGVALCMISSAIAIMVLILAWGCV